MNATRLSTLIRVLGDYAFTNPLPDTLESVATLLRQGPTIRRAHYVASFPRGILVQIYLGKRLRTLATVNTAGVDVAARIADCAALYFEKYRRRGEGKFNYSREQAAIDLKQEPILAGCLKGYEEELLADDLLKTGQNEKHEFTLASITREIAKGQNHTERLIAVIESLTETVKDLRDRITTLESKTTVLIAPTQPVIAHPALPEPSNPPYTYPYTVTCGDPPNSLAGQAVSVTPNLSGAQ